MPLFTYEVTLNQFRSLLNILLEIIAKEITHTQKHCFPWQLKQHDDLMRSQREAGSEAEFGFG